MVCHHFFGDIEACNIRHIHVQEDHMIRHNRQLLHELVRVGKEMGSADSILLGKFNLYVLPEIVCHRCIVIADGNGKVHLSICLRFILIRCLGFPTVGKQNLDTKIAIFFIEVNMTFIPLHNLPYHRHPNAVIHHILL